MVGKEVTICKHIDIGFAVDGLLHCGEITHVGNTHEGRNRESSSAACAAEAALICGEIM